MRGKPYVSGKITPAALIALPLSVLLWAAIVAALIR